RNVTGVQTCALPIYNLRNFAADQFASYTMVNAGLGWGSNDDKWEINLDVKNLTNEHAGVQGFDLATLCGCNEESYQPPRWTGIKIGRASCRERVEGE